ncbi:MAG: glycosyltransferase, partial [Rhodothermia bacterium]
LLIGPLPPPFGGARVSFRLFYDFLFGSEAGGHITHLDLPFRKSRDKIPPGGVDHLRTSMGLLKSLRHFRRVDRVVIFGSRNFCFSYGVILLVFCKIFRIPGRVRFFGGHPARVLERTPYLRGLGMRSIGLAERLVVETEVAVTEFPEFLWPKIEMVHAYRLSVGSRSIQTKSHDVKFVYVGHVTITKGVPDLATAFKEVSESASRQGKVELHVYGAGDNEIVEQLSGVQGVHYHGRVPHESLVAELPTYDVFVFPSGYENEGHQGVIVEALMIGMPVIATNLPGPMEILTHGENSLLVEVGDTRALASAMEELVNNSELRMSLARGAEISGRQFDSVLVLPELARAVGLSPAGTPPP